MLHFNASPSFRRTRRTLKPQAPASSADSHGAVIVPTRCDPLLNAFDDVTRAAPGIPGHGHKNEYCSALKRKQPLDLSDLEADATPCAVSWCTPRNSISSISTFIQNHFHRKTLSSKNTSIRGHPHPSYSFIPNHSHPYGAFSSTPFIQNHLRTSPQTRPLTEQRSDRQRARTFSVAPVHEGFVHREHRQRLSLHRTELGIIAHVLGHIFLCLEQPLTPTWRSWHSISMLGRRAKCAKSFPRKTHERPICSSNNMPKLHTRSAVARCLVQYALRLAREHLGPQEQVLCLQGPPPALGPEILRSFFPCFFFCMFRLTSFGLRVICAFCQWVHR